MTRYVSKGYHFVSLIVGIATLVIHLLVYPQLPDQIPLHWNVYGQIDKTGPKYFIFIGASLPLVFYFLMQYLPKKDPKRDAYEKHRKAYSIFVLLMVLFFTCISFIILLASLRFPISISASIGGLLGILSLILGNYMRQIRPNYFFGIRTPWSVRSDQNWRKTHRLGSILFAVIGLWLLIGIGISTPWWMIVGIFFLILAVVILYIYSYYLYKLENKKTEA